MSLSTPVIYIDPSRILFHGEGFALSAHENLVATLIIAWDEPFTLDLYGGDQARRVTGHLALLPPGQRHALRAAGAMSFLYLDPLGDDWARLEQGPLEARWAALVAVKEAHTAPHEALYRALGLTPRAEPAAPLERALSALERDPDAHPRVGLVARRAHLSISRLQHVFRARAGMSLRRYRLWRRISLVGAALATGATLTHAAHAAGFASSAHLSAVFKAMFGMAPSTLLARSPQLIVAPVEG